MAALSDYLESGILTHIFLSGVFAKPTNVSVALTSGVPVDSDTGATIPELPSGINGLSTGYARVSLGDPNAGTYWNSIGIDDSSKFKVYQVKSNPATSGYFYPLYINQSTANSASANNLSTARIFEDFPGVTLYSPNTGANTYQSGVSVDPGTQFTLYDGNGFIKNKTAVPFNTALTDWGYVSGVAVVDNSTRGAGNLLMFSALSNPRQVFIGDNIKFDVNSLEISVK